MTTMTTREKRNPIAALFLSLLTPGLGQMYNGQLKKGIVFYLLGYALVLALPMTRLQYTFSGIVVALTIAVCWRVFIMAEAAYAARKLGTIVLRRYNRTSIYLLAVIISLTIHFVSKDWIMHELWAIRAFKVPSSGMEPTLLPGDFIITDLNCYKSNQPERGDVIVFTAPYGRKTNFVKRVIAVGGDTIEIRGTSTIVNGKPWGDEFGSYIGGPNVERDYLGPVVVPENHLFVMGDNRNNSFDSRRWGFLPVDHVKGRVKYIYFSKNIDRIGLKVQ